MRKNFQFLSLALVLSCLIIMSVFNSSILQAGINHSSNHLFFSSESNISTKSITDGWPEDESNDEKFRTIALIVAISNYQGNDKDWDPYKYKLDNAIDNLVKTLKPEWDVWVYRSWKEDSKITRSDVINYFFYLDYYTTSEDRAIIFIITHGNERGILTYDDHLSGYELGSMIGAVGRAVDFVWMMSCYSYQLYKFPGRVHNICWQRILWIRRFSVSTPS